MPAGIPGNIQMREPQFNEKSASNQINREKLFTEYSVMIRLWDILEDWGLVYPQL